MYLTQAPDQYNAPLSATKVSTINIQAPEKLQYSNSKQDRPSDNWMLKFGASLDVGAWDLELFQLPF
jgi:hypothetical protein